MNFPKPTGTINSQDGMDNAGAWHNYLMDKMFIDAYASGYSIKSPEQLKRLASQIQSMGGINSTEKAYLNQYADKFAQHYNSTTDTWERGTAYMAGLVSDIRSVHDTAAADSNVSNVAFKTISNIILGSSEYWLDGGHSNVNAVFVSLGGIAIGDAMGGIAGFIQGSESGLSGWGMVGSIIGGAFIGSCIGFGIGLGK